jgi:Na+/H+-dicarboxylate symporter
MINIISGFFKIDLTKRIVLAVILGVCVGFLLRFYPDIFSVIWLNADRFKSLGILFINLIKMIIAPLIFASITTAILSIENDKGAGKLAIKSVVFFVCSTVLSIGLGILTVSFVKPGVNVQIDKEALIVSNQSAVNSITQSNTSAMTMGDFLFDIVSDNIVKSFYKSEFLQIIFFAVLFAIAVRQVRHIDTGVGTVVKSLDAVTIHMSKMFTELAPFGIFGFIVWLIATQKLQVIQSLGFLLLTVYGGIGVIVYGVYGIGLLCFGLNPWHFYRKLSVNQFTGYLIASTSAMIPANIDTLENKLGVSREKARFIIPLSATVNMNGTAFNLAVSTLFIAQLWGVTFTISQLIMLTFAVLLAAVGTAPVPAASIFLLAGVLSMFNLPVEAVGIILAIDRLNDMARTFCNISGDLFATVVIDKLDGTLDKKKYAS